MQLPSDPLKRPFTKVVWNDRRYYEVMGSLPAQ